MGLSIIDDEKSLKKMGLKKPILVVEKGNEIIKVASFNNMEMLDLFIEAVEGYGIKVVEVDEKSFIE